MIVVAGPPPDFRMEEFWNRVKQVRPNVWEIPKEFKPYMQTPARLYMSKKLLSNMEPEAIQQLINLTTLPGIVKWAVALPDAHTGYGFPIGGVAAFDTESGIISPGGVGFDINCGVRMLVTNLTVDDVKPKLNRLLDEVARTVPAGVGRSGIVRLTFQELDEVLEEGAHWAVEKGFGTKKDLEHIEDNGKLEGARAEFVSRKAKERGAPQLGTLGAGNHYMEVEVVNQIFDEEIAKRMGIKEVGQIVVMIHTGSRGLGHQIASDYIEVMEAAARKYNIKLRDKQLACAPFKSPEGERYFAAMKCGANYAFANRQMIMHWVRESFWKVFGEGVSLDLLYDVAHNIAKVEKHIVDGETVEVVVHRKGATRGFAPGRPELPADFADIGQPILVGGNMLQGSYVLVGTETAMKEVFGSTVHGAGRQMSRTGATKRFSGKQVIQWLASKGILVKATSLEVVAEEAPQSYKDLHEVIESAHAAQIAKKVFYAAPIAVWKG